MGTIFDRTIAALVGLVRGELSLDYLARYPARVVSQHADGSVDLVPDDTRVPHHNSVPVDFGIPGTTATISPGARVMLGWRAGDPGLPFCEAFAPGSLIAALNLGGSDAFAARADIVDSNFSALQTALAPHGISFTPTATGSTTVKVKA